MNERLNRLIDQAGFIKFTVEEDPETPIDWSCDYTEELNKFTLPLVVELVILIKVPLFSCSKINGSHAGPPLLALSTELSAPNPKKPVTPMDC